MEYPLKRNRGSFVSLAVDVVASVVVHWHVHSPSQMILRTTSNHSPPSPSHDHLHSHRTTRWSRYCLSCSRSNVSLQFHRIVWYSFVVVVVVEEEHRQFCTVDHPDLVQSFPVDTTTRHVVVSSVVAAVDEAYGDSSPPFVDVLAQPSSSDVVVDFYAPALSRHEDAAALLVVDDVSIAVVVGSSAGDAVVPSPSHAVASVVVAMRRGWSCSEREWTAGIDTRRDCCSCQTCCCSSCYSLCCSLNL